MGDKIDKISEVMSDRDYKKTSAKLDEQSNGGLVDSAGKLVENTGNKVDRAGETVTNVGKGVEGVGKGVETAGKATKTAGKGVEAAGKGMQAAGKSMQAAGKSMQAAGKGMQTGGQAAKAAGSGVSSAGASATDAGAALSGTGVGAIVGVPLMAVGVTGQAAGAGAQAAGTASDVAGKGVETAGKGVEKAGEGVEKAGDAAEKGGKKMQNAGDRMKKSGKNIQDKGKNIQDTGKKISDSGKKLRDKGVTLRSAANSGNADDVGQAALNDAEKVGKKAIKEVIKDIQDRGKVLGDLINGKPSIGGNMARIRIFLRRFALVALLLLVVFSLIYEMVLGPIMEAEDKLNAITTGAVNFHENMDNYLSGLGFGNSEEAFYDELEYLYTKYNNELDIPYIMATLFFDDIQQNGESDDQGVEDAPEGDGASGIFSLKAARAFIKSKIKESNVTVGQDGLEYSSNKVYRLRKLAKHSFATGMFGIAEQKTGEETVPLSEYIDTIKEQLGNELYETIKQIPGLIASNPIQGASDAVESIYEILKGKERLTTTDTGAKIEDNAVLHLIALLKQIFWSSYMDVKDVDFCAQDGSIICVTYKTYARSEEAYENYLKKYYIRYMPEFQNYLDRTDDKALDKSIADVIEQIKEIKEDYEEIFGVTEKNAEFYSNICQGNIKKALLAELVKPVDIEKDKELCFSGSYGYGTSGALNHRGLDINKDTTGNKEGDSVYSIYSNGKVTKSSKDKGFSCDDCNGGWIEIEYDAQLSDGAYKFRAIYGGLDPSSISLKKGKTVNKGQKIGKIGSKNDSEVGIPSLHFGIYDLNTNEYLDPTNLFISCGNSTLRGEGNEQQVWNYLIDYGYSEAGAAAVMGNWKAESGFLPNNLENGCENQGIFSDETFTNAVNTGKISLSEWKNYPGFRCEANGTYGYGLAQWTEPSRKENFWNFWKKSGASIDDLGMQLEWYIEEANGFKGLHDHLKTTTDPGGSATYFRNVYEIGVGIAIRSQYAVEIYNKYKGTSQRSSSSMSTVQKNPSCNNGGSNVGGQTNAAGKSNQEKLAIVFPNGVPTSASEMQQYLTTVTVPITKKNGEKTTTSVTVHKAIAQDVVAALTAAQKAGFKVYEIGGYRTFGSDSAGKVRDVGLIYSQHCYGLAVDMNVNENCHKPNNGACVTGALWNPGGNEYSISPDTALYKSFISNGWGWGGNWNSSKDYMHFSFFGT